MKIRFLFTFTAGLFLLAGAARAQEVRLKNHLLYWGTTTPNLGVEIKNRRTDDARTFVGTYNPFTLPEQYEVLRTGRPSRNSGFGTARLLNAVSGDSMRLVDSSTVGNLNLPFGIYRGLDDYRYEGYMVGGGGVSYGTSGTAGRTGTWKPRSVSDTFISTTTSSNVLNAATRSGTVRSTTSGPTRIGLHSFTFSGLKNKQS